MIIDTDSYGEPPMEPVTHIPQIPVVTDSERLYCKGCGNELLAENCWMDDGCPCNTPRGVNDGNQQISEWRRECEQKARQEIEWIRTELAAALRMRSKLHACVIKLVAELLELRASGDANQS